VVAKSISVCVTAAHLISPVGVATLERLHAVLLHALGNIIILFLLCKSSSLVAEVSTPDIEPPPTGRVTLMHRRLQHLWRWRRWQHRGLRLYAPGGCARIISKVRFRIETPERPALRGVIHPAPTLSIVNTRGCDATTTVVGPGVETLVARDNDM